MYFVSIENLPLNCSECPVRIEDKVPNVWPYKEIPIIECHNEGCTEIFVAINDGVNNKVYCETHSKKKSSAYKFLGVVPIVPTVTVPTVPAVPPT